MRPEAVAAALPYVVQAELATRPRGPLSALLEVMDVLHARPEQVLSELDSFFAPYRAPEPFAVWLAGWVDLAWLTAVDPETGARVGLPGGTGRLRALLTAASRLSAWRGTAAGMVDLVDLATGVTGSRVEARPDQPFVVRLVVPPAAAQHLALVRRIVEHVQPAHVDVQIEVGTGDPPSDGPRAAQE